MWKKYKEGKFFFFIFKLFMDVKNCERKVLINY